MTTLLAIITMASIGMLYTQSHSQALSNKTQCIYARYLYYSDDTYSKATFAEMGAQDRVVADPLDCEVEGR